ncbi:hypothetical protein ACFX2A_041205 [Malus domestica]
MEAHSLLKRQGFDVASYGNGAHVKLPGPESGHEAWRFPWNFYIELHNEKVAITASMVQFMKKYLSSESLEVGEYQREMRNLNQLQFEY